MPKKAFEHRSAALYARVSTDGQTTENQLRELREVAKRMRSAGVHSDFVRGSRFMLHTGQAPPSRKPNLSQRPLQLGQAKGTN